MNRYLLLILFSCACFAEIFAQQTPVINKSQGQQNPVQDSVQKKKDSLPAVVDSLSRKDIKVILPVDHSKSAYVKVLAENPWFNFLGKAVYRTIIPRKETGKEGYFIF